MGARAEHVGMRVRFRTSFVDSELLPLEGDLVAYMDKPTVVINMDDGTQHHIAAELVVAYQRPEWVGL